MGLVRTLRDAVAHNRGHGRTLVRKWRDARARLARHGFREQDGRLLEIGCGRLYPYTLLFAGEGAFAVGTDVIPLRVHEPRVGRYLAHARGHGAAWTLKQAAADATFRRALYAELRRGTGRPLAHHRVRLATMDATALALRDASFDACVSTAAFEHVPDVPRAVAELARALKPGAVADIEIHLFASLSGGHEPALANQQPPPPGFRPWGHLRDRDWRPPVMLNRWRERQFADAFAAHFDLLERVVTSRHGARYVTDEILAELPDYAADELGTEAVAYVLRNR